MRERHVGSVIVVETREGAQHPVGIVTDRDMVVEIIALDLDPRDVTVGELMGSELIVARENDDIRETLSVMRVNGIRRLPVLGEQGDLLGIVASDDLISVLAEDIAAIANMTQHQRSREVAQRKSLSA
jgi:signal-transduction protein with cAMP-binding, CBS, and nucleotidyltransferase domain